MSKTPAKAATPSFDLTTPEGTAAFVDHYVNIEAAAKALEAQLKDLKEQVKKTGRDVLVGSKNLLDVNIFEQTKFDGATAKTFLTPAQIKLCEKKNDAYRITVKARADAQLVTDAIVAVVNLAPAEEPAIDGSNVAIWGSHAA